MASYDHRPIESLQCENYQECRDWYSLFRMFDTDNDGIVSAGELKSALFTNAYSLGLSTGKIEYLLKDVDTNLDRQIDFTEFTWLMLRAKQMRLRRLMLYTVGTVVPRRQRTETTRYLLEYNCFPPPLFILLISLVILVVHVYRTSSICGGFIQSFSSNCTARGSFVQDEIKISLYVDPCKKSEVWRYVTYVFVHSGYWHLISNVVIQLALGIPLELVHKWWRVGTLYFAGVLSGSLLFSAYDRNSALIGASGGGYTLISAHIANLVVNWDEMELNWVQAAILVIYVAADIGRVVYLHFFFTELPPIGSQVANSAHYGGLIAGLLLGIVILRNLRRLDWERYAWWTALVLFVLYMVVCCAFIVGQHFVFSPPEFCSALGINK